MRNKKKTISFPKLGNYSFPIVYFLKHLVKNPIMVPQNNTGKTIELGSKYSPDSVCIPFKYTLGNFIESLENGSEIILQAGGGCRFSFYAEVQEQILKDLGYHCEFYNLTSKKEATFIHIYRVLKKINKHLCFLKYCYYIIIAFQYIYYMDKIDHYIRANIAFEINKNSFNNLYDKMLNTFSKKKTHLSIYLSYLKYKKSFQQLPIFKPKKRIKIGIIGELFTSMEPYSSFFLENELIKMNVEIKRFTNLSYLLIFKNLNKRHTAKYIKEYLTYPLGADGSDNIARAKYLGINKYDGIIHIKPFGCTPEISAIPIIDQVCKNYNIPIIYFSFDNQTSETGIKTRLEAFYEMLKARKEKND